MDGLPDEDNAVCADFAARDETEQKKIRTRIVNLKQSAIAVAAGLSQVSTGMQRTVGILAEIFDEMEDLDKRISLLEQKHGPSTES